MAKLGMVVAVVQFILHYLGLIAVFLGVVAFIFGNSGRGWELVIGGFGWLVLKYVIGFIYIGALRLTAKSEGQEVK